MKRAIAAARPCDLARRQFRVGRHARACRAHRTGRPRAVAVRAAKGFAAWALARLKPSWLCRGADIGWRQDCSTSRLARAAAGAAASPAVKTTLFMAPPRPRRIRPSRRLPAADIAEFTMLDLSCPCPCRCANACNRAACNRGTGPGKPGQGAAARATPPAGVHVVEPRHNRADADRLPGSIRRPRHRNGSAGPWSTTYFWGARTMATNQEDSSMSSTPATPRKLAQSLA